MINCIFALLAEVAAYFRSRTDLAMEILALRQQVAVLKRKRPRASPKMSDRLFWITLRRFWSRSKNVLLIVKPDTVVVGIALDSAGIGACVLEGAAEDSGSQTKSGISFVVWPKRTTVGALRRSTANSRNLASQCRNERWLVICAACVAEEKLADIPPESSRGNCCPRLLYRADNIISPIVLSFRHRTWPTENPTFQCKLPSDCRLDHTATAGGLPGSWAV